MENKVPTDHRCPRTTEPTIQALGLTHLQTGALLALALALALASRCFPLALADPHQLQTMLGPKYKVLNFGAGGRTMLKKGDQPYWTTGQ